MRRNLLGVITLACGVFLASNAMAVDPGGGIIGSVHDLSVRYPANPPDFLDNGAADNQARICIYCHAPHNTYKLSLTNLGPGVDGAGPQAGDPFTYLPLWNHELTNNAGAYSMYFAGPGRPLTGPKATQSMGDMVPGGTSLLCLSCHDGSVAVNSYGNPDQLLRSRSIGNKFITMNTGLIGKNNYLGNHHPVGFNYNAVQAVDTEIRPAGDAAMGTAGTVADHLYDSRVECGTCHSVHNKGNSGESLLWRSDSGSRLCLTCHDKGDLTDPTAP